MGNTTIPQQLADSTCKYIKVRHGKKTPLENEWQILNNYEADDPKLQQYIDDGGNYGVLPRGDVCIIDIDDLEYFGQYDTISSFKDTFIVRSGSGKGLHIYLRNTKHKMKIPFHSLTDNKQHLGEFFGSGSLKAYVVGPTSKLEANDGIYTIVNDAPIKEYSDDYIDEHLFSKVFSSLNRTATDHIPEKSEVKSARYRISSKKTVSEQFDLHVEDILMPINPVKIGDEIRGSHPIHGSSTGLNFTINPTKNVWHCFRDDTGGDALYLFAMKHGIIQCGETLTHEQVTICKEKLISEGYIEKYGEDAVETITWDQLNSIKIPSHPILDLKLESDNFISRYIKRQSERSDSYLDYNFAGALTILSACVQRNAVLRLRSGEVYPNIWSFCLGLSGVARKTTAVRAVKKITDQPGIVEDRFPNDFTPEAFLDCLSMTPKTFLLRDEISGFLAALEKKTYMAGMKETLCTIYDGDDVSRVTKQKKITIPSPYLTMMVATTPDSFEKYVTMESLTSGFFYRYLWFWPNHERDLMDDGMLLDEEIAADQILKEEVLRFYDFFKNHAEIRFKIDPEVLKIYTEWVTGVNKTIMESRSDIHGSIFSRFQKYALKLAMIFTIGGNGALEEMDKENSITIKRKYIDEAIRIMNSYFLPIIKIVANTVEMSERTNNFNVMVKIFERQPIITRKDLLWKARMKNAKELDDIMLQLIKEIGCVKEDDVLMNPSDKKKTRVYIWQGVKK